MKQIYFTFLSLLTSAIAQTYNFNFPPNTAQPVAWNISVNPQFIEETVLKTTLYHSSTYFKDADAENKAEGLPLEEMRGLADHWSKKYDWYKYQDEINANFSHYALTVPGGNGYNHSVPLHFVHERSIREDAVPILLIHGWPSSFLEWSHVIKPLASPENPDDQHFHVVAVDIPGYGFSPAPVAPGMGPKQLAIIFDNLMQALGYSKYGLATTDLGWWVGMWMADLVPNSLIGHLMDSANPPTLTTDLERYARNETTEEENLYIPAIQAFSTLHSSYNQIAAQSPLAFGQAMGDTPVGWTSFILYLLNKANGGYAYTYDQIITRALLLLLSEPWSSLRLYRETFAF
ncbi:hypothetical protein G6011_01803 [Alternaria panax]|uniref:Epoxide hydrolase N-terminal domain-containing protein n=1 Tax=Alternaria panax TaxID=48097 RepID=A0AAD4IL98_9PLEO|nr:hypothetical protein G6011_01803 [Alternaria panax]